MVKTTYKGKYMSTKSFKQMNKEELIKKPDKNKNKKSRM